MTSTTAEMVVEKMRSLSPEQQRTVLELVEKLAEQAEPRRTTIWETIEDIVNQVPPEAWDEVPSDGSLNVDHYLYGAPKK